METDQWPLVLTRLLALDIDRDFGGVWHCYSGERLLGILNHQKIIILPAYAGDGYSPVIRFLGRWIRLTPTPACGYAPAIGHDFTRQFYHVTGCPWTRRDSDNWFYNWLRRGGEPRVGIFHRAVAGPLGTAYIWATRKKDPQLKIIRIS
jgi:hypothetical protein